MPVIWYSPETKRWWMEPTDPLAARQIVSKYPDAIDVTNAYDALSPTFIAQLRAEAGR